MCPSVASRSSAISAIASYQLLRETGDPNPSVNPKILHQIFTQLPAALDYVHSKKYVHNDINPKNIFLKSDGRSCLVSYYPSCSMS